ncbi:MAG: hypothetical protein WC606_03350 [Candidatus Absconditabacterales bacterium]
MTKNPVISYQFVDVPADKQEFVKEIVQKNLEGKMDSYFKKIYENKDTAEIRIEYKITRTKQGKYTGDFKFNYDGAVFTWTTGEGGFKIIEDVINHAFEHFKIHLSKGK